jgi:hypothetical protein
LLATVPKQIRLAAREELTVKLPNENAASKLSAGTYRLEFIYWTTDAGGNPSGNPITVYSSTFNIIARD